MAISRIDVRFFKLAVGADRIGKETDVAISARCPVCGDSRNKNKKRLNLYTKGSVTNVNCFNGDCPVHNKTMYSFLKEFFPALFDQYKRENFSGRMQELASGDVFEGLRKPEVKKAQVVLHDLTPWLKDIDETPGLPYIQSRQLQYDPEKFGKFYFSETDLRIGETLYRTRNSVVIPLYCDGQMYGFYSRCITDKTFSTYNPEANTGFKVWNWFGVNKDEPVYIFEGIFDAMSSSLPNCIALMGASLPEERLQELKNPVFVLDNDSTGIKNSIKYAERGFTVYVQPHGFQKDMNENLKKGVDCKQLILNNLYSGISAITRLKSKL